MAGEPTPCADGIGEITRRQFIAWGLGGVGCLALPWSWEFERPPRLGIIGLGASAPLILGNADNPGLGIRALCDLRRDRIRDWAQRVHPAAELLTTDAAELLASPAIEAVVVGIGRSEGIRLARQACAEGKDVFLIRPVDFADRGLTTLAAEAERASRTVHLSRRSAMPLDQARSLSLIADSASDVSGIEIHATAERRSDAADDRLDVVLDDLRFARQILPVPLQPVFDLENQTIAPGTLPTRLRLYRTVAGGIRRELLVRETDAPPSAPANGSRIVLRGTRGSLALQGGSVDLAADVARFLATGGRIEREGGMPLQEALRLTDLA